MKIYYFGCFIQTQTITCNWRRLTNWSGETGDFTRRKKFGSRKHKILNSASKTIITKRVLFMCGMLRAGRRWRRTWELNIQSWKMYHHCTRPAGHCKIRSYSIAPSLLEGVSSSSLSNSCSFKKTVTWLEKFLPNRTHVLVLHGRPMKCPIKPILQGHMTHFSITWPLTISPLVFLSVESAPFHTPPLEGATFIATLAAPHNRNIEKKNRKTKKMESKQMLPE